MISIEEFINVYRLTNFDGITINFVFEPRKVFVTCITHSKVHIFICSRRKYAVWHRQNSIYFVGLMKESIFDYITFAKNWKFYWPNPLIAIFIFSWTPCVLLFGDIQWHALVFLWESNRILSRHSGRDKGIPSECPWFAIHDEACRVVDVTNHWHKDGIPLFLSGV